MVIADSDEFSSDEEHDTDYDDPVEDENHHEFYPVQKRREIVDFWWNGGLKRKFSCVQNRYKKLRLENTLHIWKYRLDHGYGTHCTYIFHTFFYRVILFIHSKAARKEKRMQINAYVWEKFQDTRKKRLPVKDMNLQEWASEINRTVRIAFCTE